MLVVLSFLYMVLSITLSMLLDSKMSRRERINSATSQVSERYHSLGKY